MSIWKSYQLTYSLPEALDAYAQAEKPAQFISGGTDLLLELQQGGHPAIKTLIDLNHINEMRELKIVDEKLFIGAAVPVSEITNSPLVKQHALAVSEATGLIGGPQVRNSATLGGNVAHALPAADGMISLVALNAVAIIYSQSGYSRRNILELFRGPGISALEKDEILVGFEISTKQPGEGSAFDRVMRPQGVALPILNHAVWLKRSGNIVEDIRITFGPSGPTPSRAKRLEEVFRGQELNSELLSFAKQEIRKSVTFRTSKMRATAEYRYLLAQALLEKVVKTAWKRAGENL